jgi:hypothetical protein
LAAPDWLKLQVALPVSKLSGILMVESFLSYFVAALIFSGESVLILVLLHAFMLQNKKHIHNILKL